MAHKVEACCIFSGRFRELQPHGSRQLFGLDACARKISLDHYHGFDGFLGLQHPGWLYLYSDFTTVGSHQLGHIDGHSLGQPRCAAIFSVGNKK